MAGLLDYQRIPNDAEGGSYMHSAISQLPDKDLQQALQESLAQALASGGKCCQPSSTFPRPPHHHHLIQACKECLMLQLRPVVLMT